MEDYNSMTLDQLFLLLKKRRLRGKSNLPKAGIVKCLEDHDRLTGKNITSEDGMKTDATTAAAHVQRPEDEEDSKYIGAVPDSKLQASQVKSFSRKIEGVLAILKQESQDNAQHARARGDLEVDDLTQIAELFRHIKTSLSELPVVVSPSTFFQNLRARISSIYTRKVTLNYQESIPIFDIFGIQSVALGASITPQEVINMFSLRRALLEFLDDQAKKVPAEERKFPLHFPKVELHQLHAWYLEVEEEYKIDVMSTKPGTVEENELYRKLESLFTTSELAHLSQSSMTTKSIVAGLCGWRRHRLRANQAVIRKRVASVMENGGEQLKKEEEE
jgi:hypothetical protein